MASIFSIRGTIIYEKGYKGYKDDVYKPVEKDFKLSYPTKIKKIK